MAAQLFEYSNREEELPLLGTRFAGELATEKQLFAITVADLRSARIYI